MTRALFFVEISTWRTIPDLDHQLLLQAETMACAVIRCAINRNFSGAAFAGAALLTDWYPFRLFRIGGAAFFDIGRTWGPAALGESNLGC